MHFRSALTFKSFARIVVSYPLRFAHCVDEEVRDSDQGEVEPSHEARHQCGQAIERVPYQASRSFIVAKNV